jgi:hypothetical protein
MSGPSWFYTLVLSQFRSRTLIKKRDEYLVADWSMKIYRSACQHIMGRHSQQLAGAGAVDCRASRRAARMNCLFCRDP